MNPPHSSLSPAELERLAFYRHQLEEMGIDPDEPDQPTDATAEETYAWLEGRGPCPSPR